MRNRHWLFDLARALAVVGALGIGSAVAVAQEDSDSNRTQNRAAQSSDDDEDADKQDRGARSNQARSRTSRDNDSDDSDSRSQDRDSQRESSDDDSEMRDERSSRTSRDSQSRSSRQSRDSQQSSRQRQDFGVEFESDDDDQLTVSNIEDDSIASRARLAEDDVIISVDGRRFNDERQLSAYLQGAGNRRVPIIIERDGTRYTVQLQSTQRQQSSQQPSSSESGAWLGVYLDDNEDGPVITQVYPNGPAARAGLRKGDVVVQFNDEDVTDSEELVEWIEKEDPNSRARFTVLRDDREMTLTATLADREQFVARTQNQNSNQYSQDDGRMQYSQRQNRQNENWQDDNYQGENRQGENYQGRDRQYTNQSGQRNDSRGYSSYNYPGRGQQMQQESRQTNDQHQRLERMIQELREEVRDLRDRVESNNDNE